MYLSSHPPVEIPKWFSPTLHRAKAGCMATGALFYDVTQSWVSTESLRALCECLHTVCSMSPERLLAKNPPRLWGDFDLGSRSVQPRPTRLSLPATRGATTVKFNWTWTTISSSPGSIVQLARRFGKETFNVDAAPQFFGVFMVG